MKKLLLVAGIVSVIACVLSLLIAALGWFGYYNVLDGSADMYVSLHRRMIVGLILAVVFAAMAAVCFLLRAKR